MRKEKYIYNEERLQFEKYQPPFSSKVYKTLAYIASIFVVALLIFFISHALFPTPKELGMQRELDQMEYKYLSLNNQMDIMSKVLDNIQDRDANVHRMILGKDPVDEHILTAGIGGHDPFALISEYESSSELLKQTQQKADYLERLLVIQSKSLDTINQMAAEKQKMYAHTPSIKPVREDHLQRKMRHLSGFGMRIHPIHKIRKMHAGLDFTAPKGTPVQATGDGKIIRIKKERKGYGRSILIDHGYGYKTMYAHMQDIDVKKGEKVKKGQHIGTVGNTGTSTAPHLHYEVRINDKPVNPINYCMDGLTPEQYQELVQRAENSNQSFD